MQKIWKDYGAITIGTILIGLATKNIFDPASMVTGGVSGIAIIGKELWNLPLWVTNTVLNIPLFLAGFKIMGWKFIKRTLYATVLLSVAFYILPEPYYQSGTFDDTDYVAAYQALQDAKNAEEYGVAAAEIQAINAKKLPLIALAWEQAYFPYRTDRFVGWENWPSTGVINQDTWFTVTLK